MDLRKETIKQRAANLFCMRSSLLESVDVIEFQATDAYSSLDLTNWMYSLIIIYNLQSIIIIIIINVILM
jgi:hypothetical protein